MHEQAQQLLHSQPVLHVIAQTALSVFILVCVFIMMLVFLLSSLISEMYTLYTEDYYVCEYVNYAYKHLGSWCPNPVHDLLT